MKNPIARISLTLVLALFVGIALSTAETPIKSGKTQLIAQVTPQVTSGTKSTATEQVAPNQYTYSCADPYSKLCIKVESTKGEYPTKEACIQKCVPAPETKKEPACTADTWECSSWTACENGKQTRSCKMTFDCAEAQTPSPGTSQACKVTEPEFAKAEPEKKEEPICTHDTFQCSSWGECANGTQTRTCKITFDCPAVNTPSPEASQACTVETVTEEVNTPSYIRKVSEEVYTIVQQELATREDAEEIKKTIEQQFYDSDRDGVSDELEKKNGTDIWAPDSDGDRIMDSLDPDPLKSSPIIDTNNDRIPDEVEKKFEKKYGFRAEGRKDTDRDGISDKLEAIYGTDPKSTDTDGDGLSDGQEVNEILSNPNDPQDKGRQKDIYISSFHNGVKTGRRFPIVGVAPPRSRVIVTATSEREIKLCETVATENGRFVCIPERDLEPGNHMIYVKTNPSHKVSQTVVLKVADDAVLAVKPPLAKKLNEVSLPPAPQLENIKFTITKTKDQPFVKVFGITSLGTHVYANWTSVLFTSALIADAAGGEFNIESPEALEPGDHKVILYSRRPEDNIVSSAVQINFTLTEEGEIQQVTAKREAAEEKAHSRFPVLPVAIGVIVLLTIIGLVLRFKRR